MYDIDEANKCIERLCEYYDNHGTCYVDTQAEFDEELKSVRHGEYVVILQGLADVVGKEAALSTAAYLQNCEQMNIPQTLFPITREGLKDA